MRRGESQGRLAVVLCVAGGVVGAALGLLQGASEPLSPPSSSTPNRLATVEIHVAGWVTSPGVVSVPAGSLVVDAILAAGGLKPGALVEAVNLASPVSAGQQILVPGPDSDRIVSGVGGSAKVPVNRATATELETLPGVGPVLAGRIVAFRDQNGPFGTVEDLLGVPGIGEAKLAAIRDLIAVP